METANAFHMLILPILQCTGGLSLACVVIRLVQMAIDSLLASPRTAGPSMLERDPRIIPFEGAAPRLARERARSLNISR